MMYERRGPNGANAIQEEIEAFAIDTGLKYVRDDRPGILRRRIGKGFIYFEGKARIREEKAIARIKKLAIPPAWQNVWICKSEHGHLQATGRDAKGRKQYRYHAKWNEARNETKFNKLRVFGQALPRIRVAVAGDLRKPGMSRDKVLAAVVRVMELTRIRVGNDIYAEENDSYGLTTIRNDHATVRGHQVKFRFRGKSGVEHDVKFADPRLSRIIRNCQDLPGEELFGYEDDDGVARDVGSNDVNEYLRMVSGEPITAKDFRTWGGTVKAVELFAEMGPSAETTKAAWRNRHCGVIKQVSMHLRNTVAICRKYYVHPAILQADQDGSLHKIWRKRKRGLKNAPATEIAERVILDILEKI